MNKKRAKIEAVYQVVGVRLNASTTSQNIKNYITEHIYNTSKWEEYRRIYGELVYLKPISDAFKELIKKPVWYVGEGIDVSKQLAYSDKKRFEEGVLSVERMRMYLDAAGWECYQPELWMKK